MEKNKVKYTLYYMYRQEEYEELFDSLDEAFSFVEDMENGPVGGYAMAIYKKSSPLYTRHINEEAGVDYWSEYGTGTKFGEWSEFVKHRR